MTVPTQIKRITIKSVDKLNAWLAKNADYSGDVMLVSLEKTTPEKFVSVEQVKDALMAHGWQSGRRYTLPANKIGHVISKG